MAISATHARLFRSLPLPRGGSLLEIGEANWYGDAEPDFPCDDRGNLFSVAKAFYAATFAPSRVESIDLHGTPSAYRLDLNEEHEHAVIPRNHYDVIINHGTAEHIFNIAQVFRTMHDCCADGGLMIHESPFTGWIDHGFYCLHPTLFYDVAAANNYEIVLIALEEIKSGWTLRLEDREHAVRLKAAGERWSPYGSGSKHVVIRSPRDGHGPPSMDQLEGKTDAPCQDWVRAWCPSWEIAERIAADHNASSDLPDNAMLFVCFRKYGNAAFKIPMQGYYTRTLSPAGMRAWEAVR